MAEVGDWFAQIPPITRYWFAGSAALPLICRLGVLKAYYVVLTSDFLNYLHIWKPITGVFYYPTEIHGFRWLMNLYLLYNYSKRLEQGNFGGRQADYLFLLLFNWICIVGLALSFGKIVLMDMMIMSVLYVYCMVNQDQIVSFWFGTRFKARYLPWALVGFQILTNEGGVDYFFGILVGHLYYFVMMKYPADQGVTLLQTPQILYNYFPNYQRPPFVAPNRPRTDAASTQSPTTPTSYDWGRGRRLQD